MRNLNLDDFEGTNGLVGGLYGVPRARARMEAEIVIMRYIINCLEKTHLLRTPKGHPMGPLWPSSSLVTSFV